MNSDTRANPSFLEKHEFIIPLALFLIFLSVTLPGISWGNGDIWHPDEIVLRSIKALHGEWQFSEINFDYPDLPQYAMYGLGKIVLALGYSDAEVLTAARVLSAVLAGLTIVLTYLIARRAGGGIRVAGLGGLFLLCVSEVEHNARFAHNDTYVMFFSTLAILLLVEYWNKQHRAWLYASFFAIGMAASSKYIGGSLLIVPLALYVVLQRKNPNRDRLAVAETLFIGIVLTFLGYAVGTPKALFWMTYYFKRVFAALQWQSEYGHRPDSLRGIAGQYSVLANGLGMVMFLLFSVSFFWVCYQILKAHRVSEPERNSQHGIFSLLLFTVLTLDLPMTISYNYQFRYFLTIMPILAVFAAFFVEDLYRRARRAKSFILPAWIVSGVAVIVALSIARILSVMLLFLNDARIPASEFIKTLPAGTSLEDTFYPPTIPEGYFEREHNYPLFFQKAPGEQPRTDKSYAFNTGEAGLDERGTDYLVVDSFTADRFNDPYICKSVQVECDFFKQLATGQSKHYKLIAEFSYSLPAFLPQLRIDFVNPTIRVYERIK